MSKEAIQIYVLMQFLAGNLAQEPCTNYTWLPDPKYRGSMCPSVVGRDLCDKYTDVQWFRVEGDAQIVTEKVKILHCATAFPIWMNGSLPSAGMETNATGCVNKGMSESTGACDEQLSIKIKECSGFYVYYLEPPTTCNTAYCFGAGEPCPDFEPCDFYYHDKIKTVSLNQLCELQTDWILLEKASKLPLECPEHVFSGFWINGTNPLSRDILPAVLCYKYGSSCCDRFAEINYKNCSGSLVFNIPTSKECLCYGMCYNSSVDKFTSSLQSIQFQFVFFLWTLYAFAI